MTAENYLFNNSRKFKEGLIVYPETNIILHGLNNSLVQRVALIKDSMNVEFLEYDWYKNNLWVGLIVHPSYPATDIHDFYLGKFRRHSGHHGVHFTRGNGSAEYYLETQKGNKVQTIEAIAYINWDKMGVEKGVGPAEIPQGTILDPSTGKISFKYRLMPAQCAPIGQVTTKGYTPNSTLTVDTSYLLGIKEFEHVLGETKFLLGGNPKSPGRAEDFCNYLQEVFSPYFPMDQVI